MIDEKNPFASPPAPTPGSGRRQIRENGDSKPSIATISLAVAALYVICILAYVFYLPEIDAINGRSAASPWRDLPIVLVAVNGIVAVTLAFAFHDRKRAVEGTGKS